MQNMIINFFGDFVTKGSSDYRLDQKLTSLLRSADYNAVNFEAPIQQGLHIKPQSKSGPKSLNLAQSFCRSIPRHQVGRVLLHKTAHQSQHTIFLLLLSPVPSRHAAVPYHA